MTQKTTVYLPDDLKQGVEREAKRRNCSEAQVIRDAVAVAVERPRPRGGFLTGGEPFADRIDEMMTGFGES